MDKNVVLARKFSVGLCLNEPEEKLMAFFQKNRRWLNSVYFSLPLGSRYYSREALAAEYDGNADKLLRVLEELRGLGIRREMAINTWDLAPEDLQSAVRFCRQHSLSPEEIVCLRAYGQTLSEAFPTAEIKYSVNNPEADGSGITEAFNTLVAGKGLLRDMQARHAFLRRGFQITLLLNNGCIEICNTACETVSCHRCFDWAIDAWGLDYTYARCSFFPSELGRLLLGDPSADRYKFKISNRPLGLDYTQQVLDAYLSLEDPYGDMERDWRKLALFCVARPLAMQMREVDLQRVNRFKGEWTLE